MKNARKRNLYLVDKTPSSARQLSDLLPGDVYEFTCFTDEAIFEAALDALEAGTILLSVNRSTQESLDLMQAVRDRRPDLPVIALCQTPDLTTAVAAMRKGAVDCIAAPPDREQLTAALRAAEKAEKDPSPYGSAQEIQARLTARQFQVLKLLIRGMQNKRVGKALEISERTVEIHRAKIMQQLEVSNFASLVRLVTKAGIEPD